MYGKFAEDPTVLDIAKDATYAHSTAAQLKLIPWR